MHDLYTCRFALRYPTLSTDLISSTTVPRVIDSSHFFAQGFFGLDAKDVEFLAVSDDPVSWLTPWKSCSILYRLPPYEVISQGLALPFGHVVDDGIYVGSSNLGKEVSSTHCRETQ